jgi:prepilin-type N-terminal cleavage/methylation domain-containing protein
MTKRDKLAAGFTLIELLVVMAIMLSLMGIGALGFFGMRRGMEMRGAISTVRTTLMLARQQAVTKRKPVTVEFVGGIGAATNVMKITAVSSTGDVQEVHRTAYLPAGVEFGGSYSPITFTPIGGAGAAVSVIVQEKVAVKQSGASPAQTTIRVWPMTGITKVE